MKVAGDDFRPWLVRMRLTQAADSRERLRSRRVRLSTSPLGEASFVSERDYGIDQCRPPRRNIAREQRHCCKHERHRSEREWIHWSRSKEQVRDQSRYQDGASE